MRGCGGQVEEDGENKEDSIHVCTKNSSHLIRWMARAEMKEVNIHDFLQVGCSLKKSLH